MYHGGDVAALRADAGHQQRHVADQRTHLSEFARIRRADHQRAIAVRVPVARDELRDVAMPQALLRATQELIPATRDIELHTDLAIANCNRRELLPEKYRARAQDEEALARSAEEVGRRSGGLRARRAEVQLAELGAEVCVELELRAQAAGVTLACDIQPLCVQADVGLLRRVLENLVENAIRHAPEASEVRVSAVRVDGGQPPAGGTPWTTYLAGQRLTKSIEAGYMPVSVVATFASVRVWAYCMT